MRVFHDAGVLAHDLPLGRHDQPVGVDPQADRPVGERGWNAVAVGQPIGPDHESRAVRQLGVRGLQLDAFAAAPPMVRCARSSRLGRSGTLNLTSTASDLRYLQIVFRDNPVRLSISQIEI